ncbi:hypothetical protein ACGF3G_36090 [Streptomyces sp. NPDC048179]|uniref:hypothetical protein n=1 Tax=Streptomyces sp. NPDC048179 TaxID=3365506 RepID=UPI00371C1FA9
MGTITPQQRDKLAAAVRGYHLLTGGKFVMHPPGFLGHTCQLSPERANHPIIAGPDDFDVPQARTLTERGLLWASW